MLVFLWTIRLLRTGQGISLRKPHRATEVNTNFSYPLNDFLMSYSLLCQMEALLSQAMTEPLSLAAGDYNRQRPDKRNVDPLVAGSYRYELAFTVPPLEGGDENN